MTDVSTAQRLAAARKLAAAKSTLFETPKYGDLRVEFERLFFQKIADHEAGNGAECEAIVLVGDPGAGKSFMTKKLLDKSGFLYEGLQRNERRYVHVRIPASTTLMDTGAYLLKALDAPVPKKEKIGTIWAVVFQQLRIQRVNFVVLDEVHELIFNQRGRELNSSLNTLKALVNEIDWPVNLLLVGTLELADLINTETQVVRRVRTVKIEPVSHADQGPEVSSAIEHYASLVGMTVCPKVLTARFLPRLFHAADYQPGWMLKMIIESLRFGLEEGRSELRREDFSRHFRHYSGCSDGMNPFLSADYEAVSVRQILPDRDQYERREEMRNLIRKHRAELAR
ncbi:TniB family NTP-binding protein [Phaeobacter sp. HF9A]|uniref:TniB family NTP-binding protein n=1 Tax=Phaeobacter sp. HF9A TaxID=2721561 RepID=UPI00142F4B1E|nr:TniB family NTP-binding protein [Phaeobacter sp. HF9A]NIZ11928.1 AAA family ATPase [Phaeobacter sp. HF9A]